MLTHIRMKNFKSWADSGEVALAPLTGFFGTNSSGKSSLLQMLLLLKQTIGREAVLFFGDESSLVNLGSFRDVIHGHDTDALLELECGCKPQEPVTITVYGSKANDEWREFPEPIHHFTLNTSIRGETENPSVKNLHYGLDSRDLPEIRWEDDLLYKNLREEQQVAADVRIRNCYGSPDLNSSDVVLRELACAFEKQFSHMYYLSPTRVEAQRRYRWEGTHPRDTGQWGDKAIDALLSARVKRLKTHYNEKSFQIEERVSEWLRDMALAHAFSLESSDNGDGRDYEVRIKKDSVSPAVTLADMGYGLSQFLPVLVLCYYAPEGSTLILEQPGMHLHPKVQSQLADLLIEVVTERNLQVLVESHSEHLLTRLQLRIAEEKIGANKAALYFCENKNGVSEMKSLELDEFGNIKNWPPDFFGTVRGDLVKMTKAQMKRQKRTEG